MSKAIRISAGGVEVRAQLNESETARLIWEALPIEAPASTWGDEIYFEIPVACGEEDPREVVELGDLGYWPPGSAFCIFFGPTPASRGDEVRPASAVNIIGKVQGDAKVLKAVRSGETVRWSHRSAPPRPGTRRVAGRAASASPAASQRAVDEREAPAEMVATWPRSRLRREDLRQLRSPPPESPRHCRVHEMTPGDIDVARQGRVLPHRGRQSGTGVSGHLNMMRTFRPYSRLVPTSPPVSV